MRYTDKVAIGLYILWSLVWAYWILDRQLLYGSDVAGWGAWIGLALIHLVLGFAVNRGWALFLPLFAVVIAAPLGYPSTNKGEPLPLWLSLLFFAPINMAGVAIGVGARRLFDRRRSS